MNDIPANLLCNQQELERWLDDTSVPLSDDEMRDMSAYFDSESFQYTENSFCDTINIGKQKKEDIR